MARGVAAHPNLFHDVLEPVPATGWQVQQLRDGLVVYLTGLQDVYMCRPLEQSLRRRLEQQGALVADIQIRPVEALQRGATGKAPLIMAARA
jgi:hypothetical protein